MLFNDEITLYNMYKVDGVETWKKTLIDGVQWKRHIEKTVSSDGKIIISKTVSVTIPIRDGYVPPVDWLKAADKSKIWTLNPESNLDFMVLGSCDKVISVTYKPKDLKADVSDVITIKGVSDNTNRDRLKHWKVVGS